MVLTSRALDRMLARGRQAAEARMRATCTIERKSGEATDSTTGVVSATWTSVYTGKCRLADFNAHPSTPDVAGQTVVLNQPRIVVPVSAPVILPGDRVTLTADPDNAANVGSVMRVMAVRDKSQETQRHVLCDDIQSGGA